MEEAVVMQIIVQRLVLSHLGNGILSQLKEISSKWHIYIKCHKRFSFAGEVDEFREVGEDVFSLRTG